MLNIFSQSIRSVVAVITDFNLTIYKNRVAVCLSVCLSVHLLEKMSFLFSFQIFYCHIKVALDNILKLKLTPES